MQLKTTSIRKKVLQIVHLNFSEKFNLMIFKIQNFCEKKTPL